LFDAVTDVDAGTNVAVVYGLGSGDAVVDVLLAYE
jgi:hypothetical protein